MNIYRIYRITLPENIEELSPKDKKELEDLKKYLENQKEEETLKIDGKHVQFFKEILAKTSILKEKDNQNWILSFFTEEPSLRQDIAVERHSSPESKAKNFKLYEELCRLSFTEIGDKKNQQPTEKEIEEASYAVRESKAIKEQDLIETSANYVHVDGRGMMFLSKIGDAGKPQCERNILLLALAHAYLGAMEKISDSLANCIKLGKMNPKDEQALREVYLKTAQFNAKYMFSIPVKRKNTSLVTAWHLINNALKIEKINNELSNQINTAHHILKIDSDEKQAQREREERQQKEQEDRNRAEQDRRLNITLAYIGFIVSLMGLISVYKDIKELWFP